jgi:hypothetical protein
MEEHRYYSGNVVVPTTEAEVIAPKDNATLISDITETDYYRLRLNYKDIDSVNSININKIVFNIFFIFPPLSLIYFVKGRKIAFTKK